MEIFVFSLSMLTFVFIYLLGTKGQGAFFILVVAAMLLTMTPIGEINVNIAAILVIYLSTIIMKNKVYLTKRRMIYLVSYLFFLVSISLLSSLESVNELQALGKAIKTFAIFLPLFFLYKNYYFSIKWLVISFIISSLFFGFIIGYNFGYDRGVYNTPRFTGIFNDANYFALISLILYHACNGLFNNRFLKNTLIILIIMSQSFTVITVLIGYIFFDNLFDRWRNLKKYIPFLFCGFYLIVIYYISQNVEVSVFSDYNENPISYKLNSVVFRISAQLQAMDMFIQSKSLFLTGYGSGQSVELFGKVMHNVYMQMLFDNGVFFLILNLLVLSIALNSFNVSTYMAMSIMACNFLFDTIFMMPFTFLCFLSYFSGSKVNRNE
ncbi:hypothetical protein AB6D00_19440 [Vibrio cyclitrophicus]